MNDLNYQGLVGYEGRRTNVSTPCLREIDKSFTFDLPSFQVFYKVGFHSTTRGRVRAAATEESSESIRSLTLIGSGMVPAEAYRQTISP